MSIIRIDVNFSTVESITAGNEKNTSVSPFNLRSALQLPSPQYTLNLTSISATQFFGSGINLSNTVVSVSGYTASNNININTVNLQQGTVLITASPPFSPPWYVGKTNTSLYSESANNRVSQQITLSAEFRKFINYYSTLNIPVCSCGKVSTFDIGTTGPGTGFYTMTELMDGRVFCSPYGSAFALIYDPKTNTMSTPAGTYPVTGYIAANLLADGRVYMVPWVVSGQGRIYNPSTNTLSTPAGTFNATIINSGPCASTCLLPDGRVYCAPYRNTKANIYDPMTDTFSTPTGDFEFTNDSNPAIYGCTLTEDGRVFCAPYGSTAPRLYNPFNDTMTTPSGFWGGGGGGKYISATLLMDGRIFCLAYSPPHINRIYNPITDTITTPTSSHIVSNFPCIATGVLSDGRLALFPNNISQLPLYDPKTDSWQLIPNVWDFSVGSGTMGGGIVLRDGSLLNSPYSRRILTRVVLYNNHINFDVLTGIRTKKSP